jgi:glycerol-3-phosphate dehydrogenase
VTQADSDLDVIIIGGGVAGLWTLNQLHHQGYRAILLEADQLGCAQTLASQGMIHGGIKYALGGALTGASEAIADMPDRWRAALAGQGPVDLSGLETLADRYYLFAEGTSLGRLTTFFASRALRGRIERLKPAAYPIGLTGYDGVVYGLRDFVLDTRALLEHLRAPVSDRIYRLRVESEQLTRHEHGWQMSLPESDKLLNARRLLLCAGAGNGPLLEGLGISHPKMQLRPLHQVLVRHPDLSPLYAHCVTGISRPEPRLTITTHLNAAGEVLWYLGGAIATDGIDRSEAEQIDHARRELERCAPWLDWQRAGFDTLRIDRAEPAQAGGLRPDQAFVSAAEGCLVCWPTKLSLAPDLADRVAAHLRDDPIHPGAVRKPEIPPLPLPPVEVGRPVWASQ